MKRFSLFVVFSILVASAWSQSIQFRLSYNTANANYEVSMVPTGFPSSTINVGTAQVTVIFENPNNIATGGASIATTAVAAGSWTDQDYVLSPTFGTYVGFQTTGAPTAITNGTPVLLFTFTITAAGGNCGSRLRLLANATDNLDPTGVGADFTSYATVVAGGVPNDYLSTNTSTGFRTCTELVLLPVKFLGFLVRKDGEKAVLDWTVAGEDNRTSHYEVERSVDGVNFEKTAKVVARKQPGAQTYTFVDEKLSELRVKKVYYRVRQLDVDGKSAQTNVGVLDLASNKKETLLFPNPAKEGFTLSMPHDGTSQKRIQLHLVNAIGQVVERRDITRQTATNFYYSLQSSLIVSGEYLLKIYEDGQLSETKRVIVKK